jgi:replication fork protection complex subunit Csm3/Swi3
MATIDNIWDEPLESEPAPHLTENLVTTSEDPLFLQSDSDNEGRTGAAGPRPSKAPDDIGALFDVDDDDNESGRLSSVTYEQLQKDVLSGGRVPDDGPSSGGNQGTKEVPSKAVSTSKSKSGKNSEENTASSKRTIPKLDEELLLSQKGIPALIKDAKQWQLKGKGHEVSYFYRLQESISMAHPSVRFLTSIVSFEHTNTGLTKCILGILSTTLLRGSRN